MNSKATGYAPVLSMMPRVGDKVMLPGSRSTLEITHVYCLGGEVSLQLPGTNIEWFRVRADTLTYVERKARSDSRVNREVVGEIGVLPNDSI
jgi:hypothetical protein